MHGGTKPVIVRYCKALPRLMRWVAAGGNCITDCCVGEGVVDKDDAVRGAGRPLAATVENANLVAPDVKASNGVTKLSPKPSVTELPDVPDRPVGRASCVEAKVVPVP